MTTIPDRKLADTIAYPPRMMRADRAAAYMAMSTSQFLKMVSDGTMPQPIKMGGMTLWDRVDLDVAADQWRINREQATQFDPTSARAAVEKWNPK
jgi:predicted DNA-binding transcriptional regulator AlpA